MPTRVVGTGGFDALIPHLAAAGYTVIGPTVLDGVIVYDEIEQASDLPIGWHDEQGPASYDTRDEGDGDYFSYVVGPRTLKHYLFPSRQTLLTIEHAETGLRFTSEEPKEKKYAFVGVRPCELTAMSIQDTVFLDTPFADPHYGARRHGAFTVAVNCAVAASTCFCASMGTGPRAFEGYDLVVTEVVDGDRHEFVIESGSDAGAAVLAELGGREATTEDDDQVAAIAANTTAQLQRSMDPEVARDLLAESFDDDLWDAVAERCLSCTNCTLVCPTCFCNTIEDSTDLLGTASRERRWDSCFNREFTYLHGHAVRSSTKSRYRQWMTHKLSYWYNQFGSSGCVGCGRCITWCPAAIDITEEVAKLSARQGVTT